MKINKSVIDDFFSRDLPKSKNKILKKGYFAVCLIPLEVKEPFLGNKQSKMCVIGTFATLWVLSLWFQISTVTEQHKM